MWLGVAPRTDTKRTFVYMKLDYVLKKRFSMQTIVNIIGGGKKQIGRLPIPTLNNDFTLKMCHMSCSHSPRQLVSHLEEEKLYSDTCNDEVGSPLHTVLHSEDGIEGHLKSRAS